LTNSITRAEQLKKVPLLAFMASVIDSETEYGIEDVCKALIEKFKLKANPDNLHTINSQLISIVSIEKKKDLFLELPIYGFIRIYKEYRLLKYKDHVGESDVYSTIEVNSKEIEIKRGFDTEKMLKLKDSLEVLYNADSNTFLSWSDVFDQCWKMFEKGNKYDALSCFHDACEKLTLYNEMDEIDTAEKFSFWAKWIKIKWDYYLWEKHEEGTRFEFCLGIKEFISRNLQSWLENKEMHTPKINVYSNEHEIAVEEFLNVEETQILYIKCAINSIYGT
jgi:hypothetical protein